MIRLACLDMAGTTVADDGVVERAFVDAMATCGMREGSVELVEAVDYVRATMGRSKITVFRHVVGADRAEAANAAFERSYGEAVARGDVTAMAGAEACLAELKRAGVAVCLTTGFAPSTRQAIVAALGWDEVVDLALSPADAGRGRPAPDMILTAVLRLEIDAVDQVAVAGDTASDLEAGTRAGAAVVAGVLTGAHGQDELSAAPHTHLLGSVAEFPGVIL